MGLSNSYNPMSGRDEQSSSLRMTKTDLIRIGFVALAIAAIWFRMWEPFPRFSIIGVLATLIFSVLNSESASHCL